MLKPSWLTREQFADYRKRFPDFFCASCGDSDRAEESIEHIVPRQVGGTNDVENLRPICVSCKIRKFGVESSYWSQQFYADLPIHLEAARSAQRHECHDRILDYRDWFTQPFDQISGRLYLLAWIVAAGKTLAIPMLGFALNHLIRRERGQHHPRINRTLVLCKEQAIRDQIADDLEKDIVRFGLCSVPPRIGIIKSGSQLVDPRVIEQKDIWITCIQMLFDMPNPSIEMILSFFPLVVFDEPHYARDQVFKIVQAAFDSACFGLTGSPITGDGQQIKQFVTFSLYDYDAASTNDQSVKLLVPPDKPAFASIYEEIDIIEAVMHRAGHESKTTTTQEDGYALNIRPAISVAEGVVRYIKECDSNFLEGFGLIRHEAASHRDASSVTPDLIYPVHALIQAETIEIGQTICLHLNRMFDAERSRYPLCDGYHCEIVRSDIAETDDDGKSRNNKGKKLKTDHAWMQAKHNDGQLTPGSARFIVVIGIGREGVNNPLCGIVGLARSIHSRVDIIQRAIGRQLRAFTKWENGILRVPPAQLDTVKIISHSAFGNRPFVEEAVRVVLNMRDAFSEIPTIGDLIEGRVDAEDAVASSSEVLLTSHERLLVASEVGVQKAANPEAIDVDTIAWKLSPGADGGAKRDRVRDWAVTVVNNPETARETLRLHRYLAETPRVMREYLDLCPSDETLISHIKRCHPKQYKYCSELDNPKLREVLTELYATHARQFHMPDLPVFNKLSAIRKKLGAEVLGELRGNCTAADHKIYSLAGTAMKLKLGSQPGEQLLDDGKYDAPECHIILTRHEVWREMKGWMVHSAISNGYCPSLSIGLAIPVEQSQLQGDADVA